MPTLFNTNYPRPKDDDEFEELIRDICELEWGDPDTARFGRSGQKQYGVDVYGRASGSLEYYGAQCKLRSMDAQLSEDEIEIEVEQAKTFSKKVGTLKKLTIVTDAPRDTHTQAIVSRISTRELQNDGFEVAIWFWSDVTRRLATQRRLLIKYYRDFYCTLTNLEVIDRLIDTPLQVGVIELGDGFNKSELDVYLKFRGIHILSSESSLNDADGIVVIYNPDKNSNSLQISLAVAKYQGVGCPIFVVCPDTLQPMISSVLQGQLKTNPKGFYPLDEEETLNTTADRIFDVVYDFGYERRGKLPAIDVTFRSFNLKPDTALLDVDWQTYLKSGLFPSLSKWHEFFIPAIEAMTNKLTQSPNGKTCIQIDSRLFLPAAFTVGYYLNVRVANVGVWSRSKGASDFGHFFWCSTGSPVDTCFVEKVIQTENSNSFACVLEISIQRSIHTDVSNFIREQDIDIGLYVISCVFDDTDEVLLDEGIVLAYADYIGGLARRIRSDYSITDFHLFINLPSSLGILIGRNFQSCGRLHLYWYDNPTYRFAFTLK